MLFSGSRQRDVRLLTASCRLPGATFQVETTFRACAACMPCARACAGHARVEVGCESSTPPPSTEECHHAISISTSPARFSRHCHERATAHQCRPTSRLKTHAPLHWTPAPSQPTAHTRIRSSNSPNQLSIGALASGPPICKMPTFGLGRRG